MGLLFGPGVLAHDLNDDAMARALGGLVEAEPRTLFTQLVLQAVLRDRITVKTLHADTTSRSPGAPAPGLGFAVQARPFVYLYLACLPGFLYRVEQSPQVLSRHPGLNVVHRSENVSTALSQNANVFPHLLRHLLGCPEGQHLLGIHATTPEHQLLPIALFQKPGVHALGGDLNRIQNVNARAAGRAPGGGLGPLHPRPIFAAATSRSDVQPQLCEVESLHRPGIAAAEDLMLAGLQP